MFNLFKPTRKKLVIVDGDCISSDLYILDHMTGVAECYFVRQGHLQTFPKQVKNRSDYSLVPLVGYRLGKEVVDKYIGLMIQKAVDSGAVEITILSADYDFIDTVRMIVDISSPKNRVRINIVIPIRPNQSIPSRVSVGSYSTKDFDVNIYRVKPKKTPAK